MGSRAALGKISDSGQDFFFAFVMESEAVSQCMGKILPGQDPAHGSDISGSEMSPTGGSAVPMWCHAPLCALLMVFLW